MNVSEVQRQAREIAARQDDPEGSAMAERELMLDVLRFVASGQPGGLELAREVVEIVDSSVTTYR